MRLRGVVVERQLEHTTKDLRSGAIEKRVDGILVNGEDLAEFSMKQGSIYKDVSSPQINPEGCVLTVKIAWLSTNEPTVRKIAEEIVAAFPGTTVMSPDSLTDESAQTSIWHQLLVVGWLIVMAVVVLGVVAVAFSEAARLLF